MPLLTREAILSKKQLRRQVVSVPEWDGEVIVRELMADEAEQYELYISRKFEPDNKKPSEIAMRAKLVALACINEDGSRVFTDADAAELGKISRSALDRVASVASELSGYTKNAQADVKKNSLPNGSLSSDSHSPSESLSENS